MEHTYRIEVDCANCAARMEREAAKIAGIKRVGVNFMGQKMWVEFEEGADEKEVMAQVKIKCRKIERDFEIYL